VEHLAMKWLSSRRDSKEKLLLKENEVNLSWQS